MGRITSKKFRGVQYNKLQNGDLSYSFRYEDSNGKTKRVSVGLKSAGITEQYVYQKRVSLLNALNLGEDPSKVMLKRKKGDITTFDDVAKSHYEANYENKSNQEMKRKYENHIEDFIGGYDITKITSDDIEDIKKAKSKKFAPKTVNGIINEVGAIFNYAISKQIIQFNPANSKSVKRKKVDNNRDRFFNKEEVSIILNKVRDNEQIYLFCLLSLHLGCRVSSAIAIKKKDIQLGHRIINLQDTKNSESYTGFIEDEELFKLLEKRYKELKTDEFLLSYGYKDIKDKIKTDLQPILNELFNEGLDIKDSKNRAVPHTFRHTFGSQLAINKTPIYTIKKLMNHHSLKMTERYAKLNSEAGRDDIKGIYD